MAEAEDTPLDLQGPYKPTIVPMQVADAPSSGSGKFRQYLTAIIVNVAALTAGSVMGWPSPSGPLLTSVDTPIIATIVSESDMSWLASINMLAAIVGTLVFGVLADRFGRRLTGLAVAIPYIISWILIAATSDIPSLYIARVLGGIGSGGTMVVCPLYVGETAQNEYRGPLGTFLAVGINSGILFTFVVGAFASYRILPIVCLVLPVIYFIGLLRLPETPVFHMKQGRKNQALASLEWYRGGPGPHVTAEYEALHHIAKREAGSSSTVTFRDLFIHRGTRRALIQSIGLFANQQFCGVIAVLSYTDFIFQKAGSTLSPSMAGIIVAILQAVSTYLSSFLVDRMGRKVLLVLSNAAMATSISVLGGCFYAMFLEYDTSGIGWLPVLCMSVYVIAFAIGLGPVPLVMLGETYTTKVRSRATSIGIAVQSISAFASIKLFSTLQSSIGLHGSLWFFGGCCLLGVVFALTYVIETNGKTLDEILKEYNGEKATDENASDKRTPLVNDSNMP